MLWPVKSPPERPVAARPGVAPAPLPVAFDERLFAQHFTALLAGAERLGGIEAWLNALGEKQRRMAGA
jgi:hypothetical protein